MLCSSTHHKEKRVTQGSLNISKTTITTPTRPLPDKTRESEEKGRDKWRRSGGGSGGGRGEVEGSRKWEEEEEEDGQKVVRGGRDKEEQ